MREIKFRMYHPDFGMKPVNECGFSGAGEMVWVDGQDETGGGKFYLTEAEVMQFTGLYDKNGKEIWEGDIIKTKDSFVYQVYFDNAAFRTNGVAHADILAKQDEVIGNIYENGDLLKDAP